MRAVALSGPPVKSASLRFLASHLAICSYLRLWQPLPEFPPASAGFEPELA